MKYLKADLLDDVVLSYDKTKTTIQGRISNKIINSVDVLGPPLNKFVDTVTNTSGQVVPILSYLSPNGRLFSIGAETSGLSYMSCHEVDLVTGALTFVGTIRVNVPEIATTTHVFRGLKVIDSGTTGWSIYFATTASVLINGGVFCVNNVDKADFIPVGFTLFPFATGSNQKAVYSLQEPANIGVNHLNVASTGISLDLTNNKLYVHNGVAATHQYYVYNTNAVLNCPSRAATIDQATDRFTITAHGFLDNDPIYISSLTGATGLTNNTNYFVRNATANDFQVSATTGGAAINITTNGTSTVSRSFGTTGDAFAHKTGNLPALTGTLISSDSEDYAVPGHTSNAGHPCVFFSTSTNLYLGRLSELTSGAVVWPSLVTSNILGSANQITAPTLTLSTWSNILDRAIYITNANILVMKQVVNNSIDSIFGGINNIYREATTSDSIELGAITITALDVEDGWLLINGSTVGQRGQIITDIRSDVLFDYSYIVTKVMSTPSSVYKFISTYEQIYDITGSLSVQYRTSGFDSISGGWTSIPYAEDLSGFAPGSQVQFKILFATLDLDTCIPAQLNEFILGFVDLMENSDNWEFSRDQSSNGSPSNSTFRLKSAYSSSVPTIYYRATDLSNVSIVTHNTVTNSGNFQYSTDNGVTWLALGTIPNTVGTLLRYTFSSAPGVDIRVSVNEE